MENKTEKIKISIITITYNSEKTLRETLESVRSQKYENLEYIIIDGGSTDGTLAMVKEYSDLVSILRSEPDKGISDAMNKGILMATGDLIGIIHSDDMLEEGALDRLSLEWDSSSDVYYGHCMVVDEASNPMHILEAKQDLDGLAYGFCMIHPSAFVTKDAYQKYGIFDLRYRCAMDYDLFLRFYRAGAKFKYIDAALAQYRIGGTNMKYRRKTIDEIHDISVNHGGNRMKAECIRLKKITVDYFRPIVKKLHVKSHRVKKI